MISKDRTLRLPEPSFLPKKTTFKAYIEYKPEFDRQAYFMSLLGATDEQMAQAFGVSISSLTHWKHKHPLFLESLIRGKIEADSKVAYSLYQAAIGCSHKETVVLTNRVKEFDEHGRVTKEWTEPLLVDVVKNYPPNVTAGIKWLQARQPSVWANRLRIDGKIDISHQIDLSDFSTEELTVLRRLGVNHSQREIEEAKYEEN